MNFTLNETEELYLPSTPAALYVGIPVSHTIMVKAHFFLKKIKNFFIFSIVKLSASGVCDELLHLPDQHLRLPPRQLPPQGCRHDTHSGNAHRVLPGNYKFEFIDYCT